MIKRAIILPVLATIAILFPGCEMIEGIFKAGVWFALFAMALVAALLYLIFAFVGYSEEMRPDEPVSPAKSQMH